MRTTERQRRFLTEQGEMNQTSYFNQSGIQATITANRIAEQQAAFTPEQVQAGMAQVRQKREIEEANLALIRAAREARTPAGAAFSPAAQGMTVNVGNVSGQFEQLASAINVRVTAGITATLASFLATVEAAPKLVAKAQPPVRVQ